MDFQPAFEIVKKQLVNINQLDLKEDDYDGIYIKNDIGFSDLTPELREKMNKKNNISHFAMTGPAKNFFPYIYSPTYIDERNSEYGRTFILKLPFLLNKNNIKYSIENQEFQLVENSFLKEFSKEKLNTNFSMQYSIKRGNSNEDQLKFGTSTNSDIFAYTFRKLINLHDSIIILKLKKKLQYEIYLVKSTDVTSYLKKLGKQFVLMLSSGTEVVLEESSVYSSKKKPFPLDLPHQLIFSGAPGTGKSFKLKEMAHNFFKYDKQNTFERITFHPNINYGNFVGVYKPFPSNDKEAPIVYEYIPGILLRQLEKAYKNPEINYLVLIEEINRANVAAVFGDTFQLLDRDEDGNSDYPIALSEDLIHYFNNKLDLSEDIKNNLFNNGLYFPKNFYIWSSMNGADQGVMPIDTAFKRRWDFVKFDPNELSHIEDPIIKKTEEDILNKAFIELKDNQKISWNLLRKNINHLLLKLNIPEDKLIGPYFISRKYMIQGDVTEQFESKILMYLFEDVVKSNPKRLFNWENNTIYYSALVETFREIGVQIFKEIDSTLVEFKEENIFNTYNSLQDLTPNIENEEKKILINEFDNIIKNNFDNVVFTIGNKEQIFATDRTLLETARTSGANKFMEIIRDVFNSNDTEIQLIIRKPFDGNSLDNIARQNESHNPADFGTILTLKSKEDMEKSIPLINQAFTKTNLDKSK